GLLPAPAAAEGLDGGRVPDHVGGDADSLHRPEKPHGLLKPAGALAGGDGGVVACGVRRRQARRRRHSLQQVQNPLALPPPSESVDRHVAGGHPGSKVNRRHLLQQLD
ncbi:unnamed protein product, partial [Ectocarpus sp. 13 AM-2016]